MEIMPSVPRCASLKCHETWLKPGCLAVVSTYLTKHKTFYKVTLHTSRRTESVAYSDITENEVLSRLVTTGFKSCCRTKGQVEALMTPGGA